MKRNPFDLSTIIMIVALCISIVLLWVNLFAIQRLSNDNKKEAMEIAALKKAVQENQLLISKNKDLIERNAELIGKK